MNFKTHQVLNQLEQRTASMNPNDHQSQLYPSGSACTMQLDGSTDLSLFRSHSMPIPAFSGNIGLDDDATRGLRAVEDSNQDKDDREDDEDDEEDEDDDLLATPPFVHPSITQHSSSQKLFSCSLPSSLDRRKKNYNHIQHENPLDEFFQLTQPMREGVISREKLLPSSRMKQVGIGGRGRRALSNHKMTQMLISPTSEFMKTDQDGSNHSSPVKLDQNLFSPGSSSIVPRQSENNNLSNSIGSSSSLTVNSQFAEVPLIRPRPVLAWDYRGIPSVSTQKKSNS